MQMSLKYEQIFFLIIKKKLSMLFVIIVSIEYFSSKLFKLDKLYKLLSNNMLWKLPMKIYSN